jgi:hypothetical protein
MNTEAPGALPVVALDTVVSDYHCLNKLGSSVHHLHDKQANKISHPPTAL